MFFDFFELTINLNILGAEENAMYEKPEILTYTAEDLAKLAIACASCGCYCHSDAPGDFGSQG